jgi:hypothetical protein
MTCGVLLLLLCLGMASPLSNARGEDKKPKDSEAVAQYLACNIWYQDSIISSINYKRGLVLGAGTEVAKVKISVGEAGALRGHQIITFTVKETDREFSIKFLPNYFPGWDVSDFRDAHFTTKPFEELTKGMTKSEVAAIADAKLKVGMSKEAVLAAYGYPPRHRTPSLKDNVWTYWTSTFRTREIFFDQDGRTIRQPVEPEDDDL